MKMNNPNKRLTQPRQCLVCSMIFPINDVGGGNWPIRKVKLWADAMICRECREGNQDGIVPGVPLLEAHFAKHGITPVENADGFWPIPQ